MDYRRKMEDKTALSSVLRVDKPTTFDEYLTYHEQYFDRRRLSLADPTQCL